MFNYISRPKNSFWAQTNSQNSPKLPKKAQNDPKTKKKQKILQNERYQSIQVHSKKFHGPNPKNSQKWPKKAQNQKTENLTKWKVSIYLSKIQNKIVDPQLTSKIAQKAQNDSKH